MSEVYQGGCLCGAISIEITPPTKFCAHCHCSMCRRAHAAPIVTWVGVPEMQLAITRGTEALARYQSSPDARRSFCKHCGTTLFFEGARWPNEVHVARACIPGAIDRQPQAHCYSDVRVEWIAIDDHLPKLGGPSGVEPLC